MAGLACATRLAEAGLIITLLDKGRGPGGRMAARRTEIAGEIVSFDHGAQYFTARDREFRKTVAEWAAQGVVAPWAAAGADAWVGTPGMNGPIRAMAQDLDVRWSTRAEALIREGDRWRIEAGETTLYAKAVAVAVPAEQADELLRKPASYLAEVAAQARSEPCWAVMAGFARPIGLAADVLRAPDAAISWAARNSAKPLRSGAECWVLHASHRRSAELIEETGEAAAQILLGEFFALAGVEPVAPIHLVAHRWLYSMAQAVEGAPARFDHDRCIGIAGDYLHSPRVEGAWLSGVALAEQLLAPA